MIKIEKEIELNGDDIAREFWEQDCKQQAEFFNKNKLMHNNWNKGRALIQIDNFIDCLDDNGRKFIRKIFDSLLDWEANKD
ncbi:hypothetical protein [Robinsoniella peoriensis]|uniref:hypothetical protein n=1 Tax=Robinsoniella peoriensis TaxID=180332 RepID=UPI003634ABB2